MFIVILLFSAILCVYFVFYVPLNYWKKRNVPCVDTLLFFGNKPYLNILLNRESFPESFTHFYNAFKKHRYFGAIFITKPILLLKDMDLIKEIWIKNFDSFLNHVDVFSNEPLLVKGLVTAKNQLWRDLRCTLSPAFTGNKLKMMFGLIQDCARNFVEFHKENKNPIIEVNAKEVLSRYTNDVIASVAFGYSCDSIRNEDDEFFNTGKSMGKLSGMMAIRVMFSMLIPNFLKTLNIPLLPKTYYNFFKKILADSVNYRKENNIVRPDLIHMLMNARQSEKLENDSESERYVETMNECNVKVEGHKINLSLNAMVAQAMVFYFAGFDTTCSLIAFMSYELTVNEDIQEKLRKEIIESTEHGITYDNIADMKYLHMVVSETLRKWPAAYFYTRQCTKDYLVKKSGDEKHDLQLKVGDRIGISSTSLHRDPEFFPEPDKFDPERFNLENKNEINKYSYLPFSTGPRNCIAYRLALLIVKILFVNLLLQFKLVATEKTTKELKYKKYSITTDGHGGIYIGLQKLQN